MPRTESSPSRRRRANSPSPSSGSSLFEFDSTSTFGETFGSDIAGSFFPAFYAFSIGFGMFVCLVLCMLWHYDDVIKTHCGNFEFFPSVSSAIGNNKPEKNIWRTAIALGSGPRLICAFMFFGLMRRTAYPKVGSVADTAATRSFRTAPAWMPEFLLVADLLRIFSAGMWTYVASDEYNLFHSVFFVVYLCTSVIFSYLHCQSFKGIVQFAEQAWGTEPAAVLKKSLWWKNALQIGQGVFYVISLFIFVGPHNGLIGPWTQVGLHVAEHPGCVPGSYSVYSICEWILSACNIAYDWTGVWDFQSARYQISWTLRDGAKRR